MNSLSKQQATNALERIKSALATGKQELAVIYIQHIFEAGYHHGINNIFESKPE